eukprot:CAMPEP_0181209816 /NCGR_PEP_ID=MMETSP1096-20121128/22880_1 /TAXON_ID=156174 ORGANISM="Chrysochromulina ericina, Strain CCMP281" /NCGR_SAMPLE_ID=MMETSP1096 /ASSEMBLY_ACC=CAM_ASM_000453 /LENGTH=201 /DNA_ID=CAMNT_0023301027 /DNA_START=153 /DNA_END=754 /DNA_ORIENTATION=-
MALPTLHDGTTPSSRWHYPLFTMALPTLHDGTTHSSQTYFAYAPLRTRSAAPPLTLHAVFAHRRSLPSKLNILRAALAHHDVPEYYNASELSFLHFAPHVPRRLRSSGGFELLSYQLEQVRKAVRLSVLLGRVLVLPHLRCGDAVMSFPCHAWYHRAMRPGDARLKTNDKVPLPANCPLHYWYDADAAAAEDPAHGSAHGS